MLVSSAYKMKSFFCCSFDLPMNYQGKMSGIFVQMVSAIFTDSAGRDLESFIAGLKNIYSLLL